MSIQNIDSTNFELESHAAFSEIFKRLLGYFIRILAAVIAAVLTIKIISGSNSSSGGGSKDSNSIESLKLKLPSAYRDYSEYLAAITTTSSLIDRLGIAGKEICHGIDTKIDTIFAYMHQIIEEMNNSDRAGSDSAVHKLGPLMDSLDELIAHTLFPFLNMYHGFHPLGITGKAIVVIHPLHGLDSKYTRIMSAADIHRTDRATIDKGEDKSLNVLIVVVNMHLDDNNSTDIVVEDHKAEQFRNALLKDRNNTSINDSLHGAERMTSHLNIKLNEIDKLLNSKNITTDAKNGEYAKVLIRDIRTLIKEYQGNIIGYIKVAQNVAKVINSY